MTLRSKIGKLGWMFAFSLFYIIVGGIMFFLLVLSGLADFPIGILGFLCLVTAYGLIKTKKWATWLVGSVFALGITFGATTLYASIILHTFSPSLSILLFHSVLIVYLVLTAIASAYVFPRYPRQSHSMGIFFVA